MKKAIYVKRMLTSICATVILTYFMIKTPSPKIIFLPFLICSISMAVGNLFLLLEKEKWAEMCHKIYAIGFFLFIFGFLLVAAYVSIRDKNYGVLAFSIPFWIVAIWFFKRRFF